MKKCASCTKDLPDAALHCVFCGAKQPPAPATQPAMAKTVMGYQAGDMVEQLRAQNAAAQQQRSAPAAPPQPANLPAAAPYGAPRPGPSQPPPVGAQNVNAFNATMPQGQGTIPQGPRPHTPSSHGPQPGGAPPASAANAATMFAPPMSPPAQGHGQGAQPYQPPAASPGLGYPAHPGPAPLTGPAALLAGGVPPAPAFAPAAPATAPGLSARPIPVAPIPSATPPYLASQTAARSGRPIEPWKDSLRMIMFIWGALLLAAFATPVRLDPLTFNWDAVIHGGGAKDALPPLIMAAVGLLSIVIASIPLSPAPRGAIAAVLAIAGVIVPMVINAVPPWTTLVATAGMLVLIPSLLARHEYRDAALPRILITLGALAALVPWVVPQHDAIPLVEMFKAAIDSPGKEKILVILVLVQIVVLVLALLAWLPAPSSGLAQPLAWVLILWPLVMHAALLFLVGDPAMVEQTPYAGAASWITGSGSPFAGHGGGEGAGLLAMLTGSGIGVAYLALVGYGGATVLGKNLE